MVLYTCSKNKGVKNKMNLTFKPIEEEKLAKNNLLVWARKLFGPCYKDEQLLEMMENYVEKALNEEE